MGPVAVVYIELPLYGCQTHPTSRSRTHIKAEIQSDRVHHLVFHNPVTLTNTTLELYVYLGLIVN